MKEIIQADVVVIGAGPGGLTAALYTSRSNLKTVIIEQGLPGGEINNTADIENYPGYALISGPELAEKIYQGAMAFGAEHVSATVQAVEVQGLMKRVITDQKIYEAPVVILATGAKHRKLQVPGEEALSGKGVSYCAVCDGFFFRNRQLVVVGGGDSAVEEGTYLTQFADQVTIVHRRDQLRAQKILQDRAFNNDKVDFIWESVVEEIVGDQQVEGVQLRHVTTGERRFFPCQGVFVYVGLIPNSQLVARLGVTDSQGWVLTNGRMETSIPGLMAVGDVRQTPLRQIATAVGDGAHAGQMAYQYLQDLSDQPTP